MATLVTYNGVQYSIPTRGELNWDSVNPYLVALSVALPAGGAQVLTSELDFGASFGLKSLYYKSRTTNPAASGQIRLANGDTVSWRNVANSADLGLSTNSNNRLALAGVEQVDLSAAQTLTNKTLTAPIISAADSSSTITQPAWINVSAFSGTWVNFGGGLEVARYHKNALGYVVLGGIIRNGTTGTLAFTLPVGYRPPFLKRFTCASGTGTLAIVSIDTDGTVVIYSAATADIYLDNIIFPVV